MLTHLDEKNRPKMVDVTDKSITTRIARASGVIYLSKEAFNAVRNGNTKKGPVLQTAIIAAIQAAKKTSELIPMCHPLLIGGINCEIEELVEQNAFKLFVTVKIDGKTGVEMEALTAVSVGLLTVYDMLKAIDKTMRIDSIQLEHKSGGKSGEFNRI